jgi:L-alanine-DL-glutamate epimerase-like enolase superfamily enzyme
VVDPLRPVAGHVRPFEGPGLGIQVDEERLRRFSA